MNNLKCINVGSFWFMDLTAEKCVQTPQSALDYMISLDVKRWLLLFNSLKMNLF